MKIAGYQSLTLIDYPGVIASIVFTQGCVLNCGYCHNPELLPRKGKVALKEEEVLVRIDARRKMIEGVIVTGGEPTLQPDLPEFLRKMKRRGLLVKLDTNGVHPGLMQRLLEDRLLDYIAMDLKNVWERYDDVIRTGRPVISDNCRKTFELIQNSGIAHEFRTTICPGVHTAEDFFAIAGQLRPGERYFVQNTRFTKILDPKLPRTHGIDVARLMPALQSAYPQLELSLR